MLRNFPADYKLLRRNGWAIEYKNSRNIVGRLRTQANIKKNETVKVLTPGVGLNSREVNIN